MFAGAIGKRGDGEEMRQERRAASFCQWQLFAGRYWARLDGDDYQTVHKNLCPAKLLSNARCGGGERRLTQGGVEEGVEGLGGGLVCGPGEGFAEGGIGELRNAGAAAEECGGDGGVVEEGGGRAGERMIRRGAGVAGEELDGVEEFEGGSEGGELGGEALGEGSVFQEGVEAGGIGAGGEVEVGEEGGGELVAEDGGDVGGGPGGGGRIGEEVGALFGGEGFDIGRVEGGSEKMLKDKGVRIKPGQGTNGAFGSLVCSGACSGAGAVARIWWRWVSSSSIWSG